MKFVHMLGLLLTIIVAPFMVASAPDIEQTIKTENDKVTQALKDEKTKIVETYQEKKEQIKKKVKEEKAKFQEARKKRAEKAKEKAAAKAEKKASKTKPVETVKSTKIDQSPKTHHEDTHSENATHKIANIKKLEQMTVVRGEEFMITRPASPNFGRTWKLHKKLPLQIEMIGEAKFVPAEHPGRNEGTMVFTFKGLKPGITQIEFEKVYPQEQRDTKPLKVRIVPVEIKEAK